MPSRHVGGGPGLVDKDEPLRIEIELSVEPGFCVASECPAGPARWHGRSFFARDPWRLKKRWIVPKPNARPAPQGPGAALRGDIGRLVDKREDQGPCAPRCVRIAGRRPEPSLAHRLGSLQGPPSADTRRTHAEPFARLPRLRPPPTAATTRVRRSNDKAFDMSAGLRPADSLNHRCADSESIRVTQLGSRSSDGVPADGTSFSSKMALSPLSTLSQEIVEEKGGAGAELLTVA